MPANHQYRYPRDCLARPRCLERRSHHAIIGQWTRKIDARRAETNAMPSTREPSLHPVPILSLRPTQMTVGMREEEEMRRRWREHISEKMLAELLGRHRIAVVHGPVERYY